MAVFDNPNNLTTIVEIFSYANKVSGTEYGGLIGISILFIISFGTYAILSSFSTKDALLAASFVASIMSLFLATVGWIPMTLVVISWILMIIMFIVAFTAKNKSVGI